MEPASYVTLQIKIDDRSTLNELINKFADLNLDPVKDFTPQELERKYIWVNEIYKISARMYWDHYRFATNYDHNLNEHPEGVTLDFHWPQEKDKIFFTLEEEFKSKIYGSSVKEIIEEIWKK